MHQSYQHCILAADAMQWEQSAAANTRALD